MGGNVWTVSDKEEWTQLQDQAKEWGRAVLVDFTAKWCGPCRMMAPFFDELSMIYDSIVFSRVDVDDNEEVAGEAGISAMPTFQVYKDGEKVDELVGASKDKLQALAVKYAEES